MKVASITDQVQGLDCLRWSSASRIWVSSPSPRGGNLMNSGVLCEVDMNV
jgi:hypothetical protein